MTFAAKPRFLSARLIRQNDRSFGSKGLTISSSWSCHSIHAGSKNGSRSRSSSCRPGRKAEIDCVLLFLIPRKLQIMVALLALRKAKIVSARNADLEDINQLLTANYNFFA
jgi:hypothetical protein